MESKLKSKSRREFLEGAAALGLIGAFGAGNLLASCTSQREKYEAPAFLDKAPDGRPLKAGLIGCGGRGTGAALDFIDAGTNLQITALGDVFQDRLDLSRSSLKEQREVEIPDENCFTGFDAYKRVIDSDVDVVLLTTPPHFRPQHFEYAVQARKHCFIEKPVAVDPLGARSIMATGKMAEAAGLSVVAGTQLRHARDCNATFAKVKSGAIGKLIAGNSLRLQAGFRAPARRDGWSDMEFMLRNWTIWTWLSGNHYVEQFVHHIDVLNWFFEKYPAAAVGVGGRHALQGGDQYDFFSAEFAFDDGLKYYTIARRIPGCYNRSGNHLIYGTEGYTNCQNRIWDYDHNLVWEYENPPGEDGQPAERPPVTMTQQSHINLVTSIRNNTPVNESLRMASSTLVAIMGRESAYTGQLVTWDDMMESSLRLGPQEYRMGPVDIKPEPPVPGT